ncbi:Mrp/NBP35 family ATP-binding protein [soil metagenome]
MMITEDAVRQALTQVEEPDLKQDLVSLGLVRSVAVEKGEASSLVSIELALSDAGHRVMQGEIRRRVEAAIQELDAEARVELTMLAPEEVNRLEGRGVLNYVAVASGKGGVGKSTVAANLAVSLARQGLRVGLLDADIYGPSVPLMFGIPKDEKPRVNENRRIIPLERHGIKLLSMGFLVDEKQAVVWRGPMVSSAVKQFLNDAEWGDLDILVVDMPPGTGDIQLTLVQTVALNGTVIVSTPQEVALADARKGIAMFEHVKVPVLGIVENMAYFTPPDMQDRKYYLFGRGGARRLAETASVPLLGEIPIEEAVREGGDRGTPIVLAEPESASGRAFRDMAAEVWRQLGIRNEQADPTQKIEIVHR